TRPRPRRRGRPPPSARRPAPRLPRCPAPGRAAGVLRPASGRGPGARGSPPAGPRGRRRTAPPGPTAGARAAGPPTGTSAWCAPWPRWGAPAPRPCSRPRWPEPAPVRSRGRPLALEPVALDLAVVGQLAQVGPHGPLGDRVQLGGDVGVEVLDDLGDRGAAPG